MAKYERSEVQDPLQNDLDAGGNSLTNGGAVKTDEVRNTSYARPLWSTGDKTVTVGPSADYSSLQTAIYNELPMFNQHSLIFDIASGYDLSGEDVYIPPTISSRKSRSVTDDANDNIYIDGDSTNRPKLNSVWMDGLHGQTVALRSVEVTGTNSIDGEGASIVAQGCRGRVILYECTISAAATDGIISYSSDISIVSSLDLGSSITGNALSCKHMGNIFVEATVTGSVPTLAKVNPGYVYISQQSAPLGVTVTGDRHVALAGRIDEHYVTDGTTDFQNVTAASNGSVELTNRTIRLNANSAGQTINTLTGGQEGTRVTIRRGDDNFTLEDGTGNLQLDGNFSMDDPFDTIRLVQDGVGNWLELSRSNNG
jgi:hypothetical protein